MSGTTVTEPGTLESCACASAVLGTVRLAPVAADGVTDPADCGWAGAALAFALGLDFLLSTVTSGSCWVVCAKADERDATRTGVARDAAATHACATPRRARGANSLDIQ